MYASFNVISKSYSPMRKKKIMHHSPPLLERYKEARIHRFCYYGVLFICNTRMDIWLFAIFKWFLHPWKSVKSLHPPRFPMC